MATLYSRYNIGEEVTLLASKSGGLFPVEYVYLVHDERGRPQSFFADIESWDVPFGVRAKILELDLVAPRALVSLPNGQGNIVVTGGQITKLWR